MKHSSLNKVGLLFACALQMALFLPFKERKTEKFENIRMIWIQRRGETTLVDTKFHAEHDGNNRWVQREKMRNIRLRKVWVWNHFLKLQKNESSRRRREFPAKGGKRNFPPILKYSRKEIEYSP